MRRETENSTRSKKLSNSKQNEKRKQETTALDLAALIDEALLLVLWFLSYCSEPRAGVELTLQSSNNVVPFLFFVSITSLPMAQRHERGRRQSAGTADSSQGSCSFGNCWCHGTRNEIAQDRRSLLCREDGRGQQRSASHKDDP